MNNCFQIQTNPEGFLTFLAHKEDKEKMNWSQGKVLWGTMKAPEGITTKCRRWITDRGTMAESYEFQNITEFPIYIKETELGIFISLPDSYTDAKECMRHHCHTHIWCGGEAAWLMALRMSGAAPHLGMILRKGSIRNYSVQRDLEKLSNDRGSFLLQPEATLLQPEETLKIEWEWFWFEKTEDFFERLLEYPDFPVIQMKRCTYFENETADITVCCKGKQKSAEIFCNGFPLDFETEQKGEHFYLYAKVKINLPEEYKIAVKVNGKTTGALLLGCVFLENMTEKRCRFIAEKQQEHIGRLNGAYLIYDNETEQRYYAHFPDDHNGGRERLGMGALMALWLQTHHDKILEESLEKYISYVYRELYDSQTGDVFNDIGRNNDWDRLYNYPWAAVFFMEIYKWKGENSYLQDAYKAMLRYYEKGGIQFYAIGIPAVELAELLMTAGLLEERAQFVKMYISHADHVKYTGLDYPKSEVNYEQSIVAPAVSILLQAYQITKDMTYLVEAQNQMKVLELFQSVQPDYRLYGNAIRHWDGYWFGKYRRFGDTYPHYWSVMSGLAYAQYSEFAGQDNYLSKAGESFRGCLCLFDRSGRASCAMVYPASINGEKGNYFDPWANDQDWALYYAWKMNSITIKEAES